MSARPRTSGSIAAQVRESVSRSGVLTALALVNSVDLIAQIHGTDKSSRHHGYTTWYRRHLGVRRFRSNLVFEIGIGGYGDPRAGGRSLRTLRDYMPRSLIVGIDIEEKCLAGLGRRVHVAQADQSSTEDLIAVVHEWGAPDVVIDDGSHVASHVHHTFNTLFPLMPTGGLYVIEDLETSFLSAYGGEDPPGPSTALGLLGSLSIAVQVQHQSATAKFGAPQRVPMDSVGAVHVYPGIAFIEKA